MVPGRKSRRDIRGQWGKAATQDTIETDPLPPSVGGGPGRGAGTYPTSITPRSVTIRSSG